jgi:hypothetical protein
MARLALAWRVIAAFVAGWLLTLLLYLVSPVRESTSFSSWMLATLIAPTVFFQAPLEGVGSSPWGLLRAFGFACLGIAPIAFGAFVV